LQGDCHPFGLRVVSGSSRRDGPACCRRSDLPPAIPAGNASLATHAPRQSLQPSLVMTVLSVQAMVGL